jgi:hypothetical protein
MQFLQKSKLHKSRSTYSALPVGKKFGQIRFTAFTRITGIGDCESDRTLQTANPFCVQASFSIGQFVSIRLKREQRGGG